MPVKMSKGKISKIAKLDTEWLENIDDHTQNILYSCPSPAD